MACRLPIPTTVMRKCMCVCLGSGGLIGTIGGVGYGGIKLWDMAERKPKVKCMMVTIPCIGAGLMGIGLSALIFVEDNKKLICDIKTSTNCCKLMRYGVRGMFCNGCAIGLATVSTGLIAICYYDITQRMKELEKID